MITLESRVRPAKLDDHQALSSLLFFEPRAHRHLDWRPPLDWLGSEDFWVQKQSGRVVSALACPTEPPGVAWIRLFACEGHVPAEAAWSSLWDAARAGLAQRGRVTVAAIVAQPWFQHLLTESLFEQTQSIVLLEWRTRPALPPAIPPGIHLRPLRAEDLTVAAQVDADAFVPLWHNTEDTLRRAFAQSAYATAVESNGHMLGYQISSGDSARFHLARLAVRKEAQGGGLGSALVADLIALVRARGVREITVNTQRDNLASLKLYQRLGFARTGTELPVFTIELEGD